MKNLIIIALIIVTIGGVIVFFFGRGQQKQYEDVTAAQAEKLIASGDIVVIDVREPFEFADGHIPGATLIPLGVIQSKLASLNPDSSYLLVCRSGNRSGQASRILVAQGFKNVRNMSGGMLAWRGKVER